jgi:hypothetical protein
MYVGEQRQSAHQKNIFFLSFSFSCLSDHSVFDFSLNNYGRGLRGDFWSEKVYFVFILSNQRRTRVLEDEDITRTQDVQ